MQTWEAALLGISTTSLGALVSYVLFSRPTSLLARQQGESARLNAERLLLEAREEAIRIRETAEHEAKDKLALISRTEDRVFAREDNLEARRAQLEEREAALGKENRALTEKESSIDRRLREIDEELMRVANLDKTKARELFMKKVEHEFRDAAAKRAKEVEAQIIADADRKAKKVVLDVIQRNAVTYITEATLAVIELPNEEMKGRIIGREGRNIRAFEQVAGVDLIVDDTPETVLISSFDSVRRETARLALMNLMVDGRIHPGRIEELHEKAQAEVMRTIQEAGQRAADAANVTGLSPRIIDMMGCLRFRTSYAQNVLDHSVEVSRIASGLAAELGLNVEITRRAAFLHDIGKALGPEWEGPHALTGMEFLRQCGETEAVLHAVGAHHYEIEPQSSEAILVIIGDTVSAARPGARRESLDNYIKRLTALEELANSYPGVERSFAVQAGREVRMIVKPSEVDDLGARKLALEVAQRIERELQYPGQIKVTVIRETRVQQIAR